MKNIVGAIEQGFFLFEQFGNGAINEYQYFGFNDKFTELFQEAQQPRNNTPKICKLLDSYYELACQYAVWYDKGNFENQNCFENEDFIKDCEELDVLRWDRVEEFCRFSIDTDEEVELSISDYKTPNLSEKSETGNEKNIQKTIDIERLEDYLIEDIFAKKPKQRNKVDELVNILQSERTSTGNEKNIQKTIDIERLEDYLIEDIFAKKPKQRNKVDELVNILQSERTSKEIAEIAKFFYDNRQRLLKVRYIHSFAWRKWLSIFYEIAGFSGKYCYRQTEIKERNLSR